MTNHQDTKQMHVVQDLTLEILDLRNKNAELLKALKKANEDISVWINDGGFECGWLICELQPIIAAAIAKAAAK